MPLNGLTAAFVTLLEEDVEKPSFEVAESPDKQTIIVKTAFENGQTILNKLKEVFKSHGHTAEHIPFQLQPILVATSTASSSSGSNLIQDLDKFPKVNFPLVDLQNLTGKDIFERLFSEEVRASAGVIMSWQETRGQNDQPVYYYVCQNDLEVDLRTAQVKYFKRILSHATLKDLYIALAKEDFKPLSMPSADVEGNGPLSAHLDSLFSIRQESEVGGKFVIRFDCIGLVKCIIAPQFSVAFGAQLVDVNASSSSSSVVSHSDTVEIHVSHSHFMAYMSTLLNQGVLLQEHNNRLRPIALHGRHAIQQSTLIDFGIDCSGSMRDVFPRLKALLIEILQKLPKTLDINATTIRISRFGSKDTQFPLIEFPLTQLSKLIKAVRSFELGNDQTALYQFLVQEYALFKRFENFNVVFVLLSDGGDNDSDPSCVPKSGHEDQLTVTLRSLENAVSPPQFFSIEIGNLTDAILEVIKQKTGGNRMQAGSSLESFEVFFNHLGELAISRHFLHFAQEARRFKLPVVAGKIIIADLEHYLVPGVPFQMNGVSYKAERQDLSRQTEPLFLVAEERKQKEEQEEIRKHQHQAQLEQMRQEFAEAQQKQLQDFQGQLQEVRVQLQASQTLQQQQQQELEQLRNENTRLRLELQAQQHNSVALASHVALTANDSDSASQSSGASVTAVLQESLGDEMSSLSARSATALNQINLTESNSSSSSVDARDPASVSSPGILSAFDAQRQRPAQSAHTNNSLTQKQPPKRSWWDCSVQ